MTLDEFKALLGVDDREDKLARFCLVTATFSIEQYCKRRFLGKKYFERIDSTGDLILPLREYPASKILAAFAINANTRFEKQGTENNGMLIEPEFYRVIPNLDCFEDIPYFIELSPALKRYPGLTAVKVIYWAGYVVNPHPCGFTTRSFRYAKTPAKASKTAASMPPVPADLASACLELAAWNMNRYKGRRIGMTGNVRGAGKDGEHFELATPKNVLALLEPYRRKTI